MRILHKPTIKSEYPKEIQCPYCDVTLEYDKEDIEYREYGQGFINCINCYKDIVIDECINLTIENIQFPNHFVALSKDVANMSDKDINKWIKECLEKAEEDNIEYGTFRRAGTVNTLVIVLKYEDEYIIYVTKDYYEASIMRDE